MKTPGDYLLDTLGSSMTETGRKFTSFPPPERREDVGYAIIYVSYSVSSTSLWKDGRGYPHYAVQ